MDDSYLVVPHTMPRHPALFTPVAITCILAGLQAGTVFGQVGPGERIRLQDQLETGLRPGRPRDKDFVRRVAAMTESGDLPRSLVDSTFQWARKKPRYKVQYFEQALRIRARRLGIEL